MPSRGSSYEPRRQLNNVAQQEVALITGTPSEIGRAAAILLANEGYTIFGTTRKPGLDAQELSGISSPPYRAGAPGAAHKSDGRKFMPKPLFDSRPAKNKWD